MFLMNMGPKRRGAASSCRSPAQKSVKAIAKKYRGKKMTPEKAANVPRALYSWFTAFKHRNGNIIDRRTETPLELKRSKLSKSVIDEWYSKYRNFLISIDCLDKPSRIWNADESGFNMGSASAKVIGPTRRDLAVPHITAGKQRLTVMYCGRATGEMMPPFFVFPEPKPRSYNPLNGSLEGKSLVEEEKAVVVVHQEELHETARAKGALSVFEETLATPVRDKYNNRIEEGYDMEGISPCFDVYRKLHKKAHPSKATSQATGLDLLADTALQDRHAVLPEDMPSSSSLISPVLRDLKMNTPSLISGCSLQLTGLFARLQQGKISVENANIELIRITDDLDKAANNCKSSLETVIMENKKLRQQNQGLHKDAYNKQEQILRLQSKTLKLESERNEALTELAELKKWTEDDDTVLLDASGGVLDASRDVLDASREVLLDASRDVLDASADVSGDVMDASGDISGDVLDASGDVSGDVLDASEDVSGDVLDASGNVSGKVLDASGDVLDAIYHAEDKKKIAEETEGFRQNAKAETGGS
ncbi:hypothetical protein MAR_028464 [Mya arenaria]|uniref:Transposase n=1 Tax=Mya arenaria TaxID=6604 RepID=A0ABY7DDP0_MYAAR|nr:hypothetical protein MAR_028464 [Mya arenaria]